MEALSRSVSSPPPPSAVPSGVSVRDTAEGTTLVRVWGGLPIGWVGSLSTAVAEAGFTVVRGRARQTERQRWEGELELAPSGSRRRTLSVDYLLLATRRRASAAQLPIVIERHWIERDAARGTLVVELQGPDRVGFLGSLLERLAGLQLFPIELKIETVGTSAVDRLSLQSFDGREPSPEAERRLGTLLEQLR